MALSALNQSLSVYSQSGLKAAAAPGPSTEPTSLPTVQTQQRSANAMGLIQPDNPVFWVGVTLATTLGLIGFSTHFRVGRAQAGFDVGQTTKRKRRSGDE